ncbi:MAG: HlyD family secretion protein, partial [Leptolyngbyaceae bacterium]|nr:HlyD family secretion protein [Leptolyngbyaceae bacterium]
MDSRTLQVYPHLGLRSRWLAVGAIALLVATSGMAIWRYQSAAMSPDPDRGVDQVMINTVTALGRLEPQGEVINLSAPTSAQGNRVEQLLVAEGDRVEVGQVVAILDSYGQLKAALDEATAALEMAQAQLAVVQAGAKQGEIDAQRAEIARLEAEYQGEIDAQRAIVERLQAELANAAAEFQRYDLLYQEGAIAESQRDSTWLAMETSQKRLNEAQASLQRLQTTSPAALTRARSTLNQIAEVRPVDVQVAQAEVNRAIAAQQQAQVNFDQTQVRSPLDGEVLAIHTRGGETVASDGIMAIGQTGQ